MWSPQASVTFYNQLELVKTGGVFESTIKMINEWEPSNIVLDESVSWDKSAEMASHL